MRAPLIDGRDVGQIIEQLLELAPYYVPEWNMRNERDPAAAVLRIFAGQYVDTLERLNRVPDKNFIVFLSKLGISLLPATQARAPVTFRLSAGLKDAVLIPARTQVAASPTDGGKPIVYETGQPMLATPARIVELLSVTASGGIYQAPPGMAEQPVAPLWAVLAAPARQGDVTLLVDNAKGLASGDLLSFGDAGGYAEVQAAKGETITLASPLLATYAAGTEVSRVTSFQLFEGVNKQDNVLYLAHENVLGCGGKTAIRLVNEAGAALEADDALIRWQYWNNGWEDLLSDGDHLRVKPGTAQIGMIAVNGQMNRWLRGQIIETGSGGMASMRQWQIKTAGDAVPPDLVFSNNNPVEPVDGGSGGFYLFGPSPRTGDTLYLAGAEALSKRGGEVTLCFAIGEESQESAVKSILTDEVSWEYWNGGGWLRWDRQSIEYEAAAGQCRIQFRNGNDIALASVQGQENYWIRCRLLAFNADGQLEVAGKRLAISDVSVSYSVSAAPEQVLAYRNLQYVDWREGASRESSLERDDAQAIYIGFDRAPLRGPISLYADLADQVYNPDRHPLIEWQYYAEKRGGSRWMKLDVDDGTDHLTKSGCLTFIGLPDWTEAALFGKQRYWLRGVDTLGVFRTADSDSGESGSAPAPIIQGLHRNTTLVDQAESYRDEVIGSSRGTPDAVFTVSKVPVVAEELFIDELSSISDRERQLLQDNGTVFVEEKDEKGIVTRFWVRWKSTDTLAAAAPDERSYAIDRTSGRLQFGDGVHGMIPPIGTNNIKLHYRCGGGTRGNVPAGAITMLKSSIAYVDGVVNPCAAAGGYDTEDAEAAKARGPVMIHHRNRAVTAADYESLAFEAARGIARVKCLPNVNEQGLPQAGRMTLIIVPQSVDQLPQPSATLRQLVTGYIQERAANVVAGRGHIHVRGPAYAEVAVRAVLVAVGMEDVPEVERIAIGRLQSFLHPLAGGPASQGWEFGRVPALSDLYALLSGVAGLAYVDRLEMLIRDSEGNEWVINASQPASMTAFPPHMLIYSGEHQVVVRSMGR
ncbi:hypothetical protein PaecuDRAFT_1767 [Paenibacillus curdlanolyticus YK9]|uniref:Uncharacterized protein n=1 Tax=Paenibacillus curdlanolyticus YK9 TaxID=717606 RepID=E0I816_9BACL|nr:putative baseplate assembly protein [Paenibacillus curdlanolyticus]EFM11321.1 hypothetical protein PaecuDRAFT_1767 [Paenibacillus curdlanolyticus YK9]